MLKSTAPQRNHKWEYHSIRNYTACKTPTIWDIMPHSPTVCQLYGITSSYFCSHHCENISFTKLSLKHSDEFKTELEEPYEYSVYKSHRIKVYCGSCVHFATHKIPNMPPAFTLSKQNSPYLLQFTQFWQYARSPQSNLLSSVMGCI